MILKKYTLILKLLFVSLNKNHPIFIKCIKCYLLLYQKNDISIKSNI